MWNLTKHECVRTLQAHEGFVRGMVVRYCGTSFFTVNQTSITMRSVSKLNFLFAFLYFDGALFLIYTFHDVTNRLGMTKQSSSGRWRLQVMERKRSHSTLSWARYSH